MAERDGEDAQVRFNYNRTDAFGFKPHTIPGTFWWLEVLSIRIRGPGWLVSTSFDFGHFKRARDGAHAPRGEYRRYTVSGSRHR